MEGLYFEACGDANFYDILRKDENGRIKWVAHIQFNGELTTAKQEEFCKGFVLGNCDTLKEVNGRRGS